jgi:hypothetical protein
MIIARFAQICESFREFSSQIRAYTSEQHSAFGPRNILVLFCPASFPARMQNTIGDWQLGNGNWQRLMAIGQID